MGNLRKGKKIVQVVLPEKICDIIDRIALAENTSRSAITGKLVLEYIDLFAEKYLTEKNQYDEISNKLSE